jgi:hypothetical protein
MDGWKVVAVGCAPSGLVAVLDPCDWRMLLRWKLDRLSVSSRGVHASGKGGGPRPLVSRFVLNAANKYVVLFRNGNLFDLRRCNLALVLRSTVIWAERQFAGGLNGPGRRRGKPSALERLTAALAPSDYTPDS